MSFRSNHLELGDAILERDLREWLRSFDPGAASPAFHARCSVARPAANPGRRRALPWLARALRGAGAYAVACAFVLLAAAILARFDRSPSTAGSPFPAPVPGTGPSPLSVSPSAFWWLPAVAGGAVVAALCYLAWPALWPAVRRVVAGPGAAASADLSVDGPIQAATRTDRRASLALVLVAVVPVAVWLARYVSSLLSADIGAVALALTVACLGLLVVPIVVSDPTAWRRHRWLVAGALLYPIGIAITVLIPPQTQALPSVDGSVPGFVVSWQIEQVLSALAPLVLAVGLVRRTGIGEGPSRWFVAAVAGAGAGLALMQSLTGATGGQPELAIDALTAFSVGALALVAVSVPGERRSWSSWLVVLAAFAWAIAWTLGHVALWLVYTAGPAEASPSLSDAVNSLTVGFNAHLVGDAALFLAFVRPFRPRLSLGSLRNAGLTPPQPDASDEPLSGPDR